jgi:pimeloyl-ACP methyl ester carboxylesterase
VELCAAVRAVYEFGGPELARRFLRQHSRGKASRAWRFLTRARENELSRQMPHCLEMDLVGRITFRELGFAHGVEDCPFNFAAQFAELAEGFEPFQGENFDLPAAMPGFHWPTVVLSGEHDLRTPRPHAQRTVALLPDAVLGRLTGTGHSALDTHQRALLHAIERMAAGQHRHVAADTGLMAGLSRVGTSPFSLGKVVGALLMADRLLPRRPLPVRGSLGRAVEA